MNVIINVDRNRCETEKANDFILNISAITTPLIIKKFIINKIDNRMDFII